MGCEGQCTVEQHSKTHCFSGDLDVDTPKRHSQEPKLRQLVYCTNSNEVSFSWFNFNQLAHIHRPISLTHVTSFYTLLSTAEGSAWKYS